MANCMVCGRLTENGQPMVLVGTKRFDEGNGQGWGPAQCVRLWKTLVLLSVGVCSECIEINKKTRIRKNIIAAAIVFAIGLAIFLAAPESLEFVLIFFGAPAAITLIALLRFRNYQFAKAAPYVVLRQYKKTGVIPQKDILAVLDENLKDRDIPIKDTWHEKDILNSWDDRLYSYDLELYTCENIDKIGIKSEPNYPNGMKRYSTPQGDEQARAEAKALFEKIGAVCNT